MNCYSNYLIDVGREVYYPERILKGDILYRDLFNIYGPLSYQINAIFYLIFGTKLSTLLGAGCACSLLLVTGIYKLAQRFLNNFLSFSVAFFTIAVGVMTTGLFNFHFPYSWALLYGLIAFIFSLYFLIDKKNLILSAFLAGICITCKYDFLVYGFFVLFFIIKNKDWKAFLSFLSIPVLSFGVLFIQGLRIEDLLNTFQIVKTMAKTKTLTYFYQNSGIYFHPKAILMNLILFIKFAIPFGGILLGVWKDKKFITILSFVAYILFFGIRYQIIFGFLPLLLVILLCLRFKKLTTNQLILTLAVLAVGIKVFWVLLMGSYGNYYVSLFLIAALAFLPEKFYKVCGIYLILTGVFISHINFGYDTNFPNKIVSYVEKNTNPTDKVVVFPEGMIINFMAKRDSDGFYNSMIPLYVETFGEEKFIEHFKKNPPEYFIFTNSNMKDYGFEYICTSYAQTFCEFVQQNYTNVMNDLNFSVYRKK